MFSGLRVFVFLGIVLLFVVSVANGQAQGSQLTISSDIDGFYAVGDIVQVVCTATSDGVPVSGASLTITHNGLTDVNISNGGTATTDVFGAVTVTGTLTRISGAYVSATWVEALQETRVYFNAIDSGISAATIVVNPPNPKFPLAVGDTFTQTIQIQNAADLAGWQMDIAFNPDVLEVVEITAGDFLERDDIREGEAALFFNEHSPGKITIRQTRLGPPLWGVYGDGVLVELTFRFITFSEALLGLHNVRLVDSSGDRLSYSVILTPVVVTHASATAEDVNQDGQVDILDLIVVANSIGAVPPHLRADVNGDGIIDVLDLIAIVGSVHWNRSVPILQLKEPNAAAPAGRVLNLTHAALQRWLSLARVRNDGSLLFQRGIATLETLLAAGVPSETRLLLNYPNPFNPETWIPYQLSQSTDVTVRIYSVNGHLIRTLVLGHQAAGIYQSKSRAVYWDGRNEFGERVASGLYFYTLTAGDFTATRKMLIRK